MKHQKSVFLLALLGTVVLIIYVMGSSAMEQGVVKEIKKNTGIIRITLETGALLILFDKLMVDLDKGDTIYFFGKKENYRGQKQIIVEKIIK